MGECPNNEVGSTQIEGHVKSFKNHEITGNA